MFAAARPRNIDLRPTARTDIALRGWAGRTRPSAAYSRRSSSRRTVSGGALSPALAVHRPHSAALAARPRRRGDRMKTTRVHRAVLLGLIGSILGGTDRKGGRVTVPTR